MICFSISKTDIGEECDEIVRRWVSEVTLVDPSMPIVFVLTKKDLREELDEADRKFEIDALEKYMKD